MSNREAEPGIAVMELAIALPLIWLIVFGSVSLGLALQEQIYLSSVSRVAARTVAAAAPGQICDEALDLVESAVRAAGLEPAHYRTTVEPYVLAVGTGHLVAVRVTIERSSGLSGTALSLLGIKSRSLFVHQSQFGVNDYIRDVKAGCFYRW